MLLGTLGWEPQAGAAGCLFSCSFLHTASLIAYEACERPPIGASNHPVNWALRFLILFSIIISFSSHHTPVSSCEHMNT